MVRYLGPENYGQLSYAVSFVGIFSVFATLGIDTVLYRELVRFPDKVNEYMGSALGLKIVAGFIITVVTIVSALMFSPKDVSLYLIIIISLTYIFNSFNIIVYEFQANVQQKYPSIVSILIVLILSVLKISVFYFDKGIIYLSFILLLESLLYAGMYSWIRSRKYGSISNWKFDPSIAKRLTIESWPLMLTSLFAVIYTRIDQVMIKNMIDAKSVGFYDASVRLSEAWNFIPAIIVSSMFPAIVNGKKVSVETYKKRLLGLMAAVSALALLVAIPVSFFSEQIIKMVYGSEYISSVPILSIYVWSTVWLGVSLVLQYFLINEGKKAVIFFSTVFAAIINIGLNLYLIPLMGIEGAAWSTFISYIVLSVPIFYILKMK
jgi:O-antigen/teichoic acid export membrane protein